MRYLLLCLGLFLSNFILAQEHTTTKEVATKYYWGISSGLQTPVRYVPAPHKLHKRYTFNVAPITELVFGLKLSKSLYLETGLLHTYDIKDPFWGMAVCYEFPFYNEHHYNTHTISMPIGFRYRTNGKKIRPSAAFHLIPIQLFALDRYEAKVYDSGNLIFDDSYHTIHAPTLATNIRFSLGMEYQLSKSMAMRLEAQTISEFRLSRLKLPMLIRPSVSLGIFRSFG